MNTCLSTAGSGTRMRSFIAAALLVLTTGLVAAQADSPELNPSHPDTYVVEKGDTLWDISSMFLQEPWYWPEIWYVNPQVANPHLIFPGDLLKLVYVDGQPRIVAERGELGETVTRGDDGRLSPRVREEALDQAITTIAFQDIQPFLAGGLIMDKGEAEDLPYVSAFRDHLIAGAGNEIFISDLDEDVPVGEQFLVLRIKDALRDPESGKKLGNEVIYVGAGELLAQGDPARALNRNVALARGRTRPLSKACTG
jgi:hypothetical protein